MAKIKLKFIDVVEDSKCITTEFWNGLNRKEIFIQIEDKSTNDSLSIFLDKSTAIKLAKTLRTQINQITESEVGNG